MDRKQIKKEARGVVKKHYMLSVVICLMALLCTGVFTNQTNDNPVIDKINELTGVEEKGDNILSLNDRTYDMVLNDMFDNNVDHAKKNADKAIDSYANDTDGVLGRTEGVLAKCVNMLSSGQIILTIYNAVSSFFHSPQVFTFFIILLALAVDLAIIIFFKNMVHLIMARIFLEESTYDEVPLQRIFFFNATGKWLKSALAYLKYQVYLSLWWCTIVGGIIKEFSYALVPYILAENPDMSGREAITLSRKMMNGHKWELFCLNLSMIGWYALDVLTCGIAGVFWYNPYYTAVMTQFYREVRALCIENKLEGIEKLNDVYLYQKADDETLARVYRDVKMDEMYIRDNSVQLTKVQKFFVDNFSIWIGSAKNKNIYQAIEAIRKQIENDKKALDKSAYPSRLSPYFVRAKKHFTGQRNYTRSYTVTNLLLIFFAFAFIGWVWEVSLHIVTDGTFVNRGTLIGPYLPIYGAGAVLAIILLTRLRNHPVGTFVGSMIMSGVIEYSTSYVQEKMFGLRWWDYTGYFLNLDGRICLEGLIVFGLGCMVAIYVLAPAIDNLLSKWNTKMLSAAAIVLVAVFCMDTVYSSKHPNTGEGITTSTVASNVINSEFNYEL